MKADQRKENQIKRFPRSLVFLVLAVFSVAGSAMATYITPTNYDTLDLTVSSGWVLVDEMTSDFITPCGEDIVDLTV